MVSSASPNGKARVFWLGCHKILVPTELRFLRELGYEVFRPPYRTEIFDQSAELSEESYSGSSLPQEVWNKLSGFNFFYNTLTPEIAELLNTYFEVVICTINPIWLKEILPLFRGKVIYRTFGQIYRLSDTLFHHGMMDEILKHQNFLFVPHAMEAVEGIEHAWLMERMEVLPYALTPDIFEHKGTWAPDGLTGVGLVCPNIENLYYRENYIYLKKHFNSVRYPLYGVQARKYGDPQIVGTLRRDAQIELMKRLNGFLYHYKEPSVCYLPPIEFMVLGGPVIYREGSLLHRYFGERAPGCCRDEDELRKAANRLFRQDGAFTEELITSQASVWQRYDTEFVRTDNQRKFPSLIERSDPPAKGPAIIEIAQGKTAFEGERTDAARSVTILFHRDFSLTCGFKDGRYFHAEGIGRVTKLVLSSLVKLTNFRIYVTCEGPSFQNVYGYMLDGLGATERCKITFAVVGSSLPRAVAPYSRKPRSAKKLRSSASRDVRRELRRLDRELRAGRWVKSAARAALVFGLVSARMGVEIFRRVRGLRQSRKEPPS